MGSSISAASFASVRLPPGPQGPGQGGALQGPGSFGGPQQQGPGAPGMFGPGGIGFSGQSSFQPPRPGGPGFPGGQGGPGGPGFPGGQGGPGGPGFPGGQGGPQGPGGGQGQQHPPLPPPELMRDLGQILKTRPEELASQLLGGQSLSQVASSNGMSGDQLKSAISQLLGDRLPQLSDDQRSKMAEGIIAGLPPPPPPQMQGGAGQ